MSEKSLTIISYLTIIGWIISFLNFKKGIKNGLLCYHLQQSLGIFLSIVIYSVLLELLLIMLPFAAMLFSWFGVLLFILLVMGIINAANEAQRPIPLIGKFFENKFAFIQ